MSSINFSNLQSESPELAQEWRVLANWFRDHEGAKTVSPVAVAMFSYPNQRASFDQVVQLARALSILADRGVLHRRFAVEAPSGQLLHPYYDTLEEIPKRVRGSFEDWVDTRDAEIRPIFTLDDDTQ